MQPAFAPSLGRTVHFTCDTNAAAKLNAVGGRRYNIGDKVAGIITHPLDNNAANLKLFPDATDECLFMSAIPFSAGNQPGTWNWAERIGEAEQAAA